MSPDDLSSASPGLAGSRVDHVYARVKDDIFEFRLLPGDRFTESQVAERLGVSRTPVREALYRLEREGYLFVHFRNGWSVRPFDFVMFENLYELRMILESAAVRKLCDQTDLSHVEVLKPVWLVPEEARVRDARAAAELDEIFHTTLVDAADNPELARVHNDVIERIRIIRRLDFTQGYRVERTYEEHAQILQAILRRRADQAVLLLNSHIAESRAEVRKITLHRLQSARQS
ncbi:GntR family transcriptional regulator [Uliginosibacterium aquaticum]|uniref:GntR family transcriptional regulator n=1 Tax=Uliginosibacterium aquaticum TaxID=2731212 RepID=A0ABX2II94_9RHOO|nr:GntR family transcriptional regulator [Uliginosibacterium aquaticum]NSL56489.1 GntR family transcriptional regulator [Uliginosibacterium aquaticum]